MWGLYDYRKDEDLGVIRKRTEIQTPEQPYKNGVERRGKQNWKFKVGRSYSGEVPSEGTGEINFIGDG